MTKQSKDKYAMLTDVVEQAKASGTAPKRVAHRLSSERGVVTFHCAVRHKVECRGKPTFHDFRHHRLRLGHAEALADYLNVTDRSAHPKSTRRPVSLPA